MKIKVVTPNEENKMDFLKGFYNYNEIVNGKEIVRLFKKLDYHKPSILDGLDNNLEYSLEDTIELYKLKDEVYGYFDDEDKMIAFSRIIKDENEIYIPEIAIIDSDNIDKYDLYLKFISFFTKIAFDNDYKIIFEVPVYDYYYRYALISRKFEIDSEIKSTDKTINYYLDYRLTKNELLNRRK